MQAVEVKNVGGQQSILLPSSLKIDDDKVYVKKEGNVLHLIPFHNPWQSLADSLAEFSDDFMAERAQPKDQQQRDLQCLPIF